MVKTTELEKKRAARQRLVLLVLTGEQPDPNGSCLDPEELAALVEGRLEPEQAAPCLTHLAGCERCYTLWRQLDRHWQGKEGTSRRTTLLRLLSQPRFLAAAGSVLAAAASIAVFLNITSQADRTALHHLPEQPALETILPAPNAESPDQLTTKEVISQTTPMVHSQPQPAAGQTAAQIEAPTEQDMKKSLPRINQAESNKENADEAGKSSVMKARQEEETTEGHTERTGPPVTGEGVQNGRQKKQNEQEIADRAAEVGGAPVATSARMRALAPQPAPAAEAMVPLTLTDWQDRIRAGCQGQPKQDFFDRIAAEATHLLRQSALLEKKEQMRVKRVLAVLGTRQPAKQQCRELLNILEPAAQGKGR